MWNFLRNIIEQEAAALRNLGAVTRSLTLKNNVSQYVHESYYVTNYCTMLSESNFCLLGHFSMYFIYSLYTNELKRHHTRILAYFILY